MKDQRRSLGRLTAADARFLAGLFDALRPSDDQLGVQDAISMLIEARWGGQVTCPTCSSVDCVRIGGARSEPRGLLRCRSCSSHFTPLAGSPLGNEKVGWVELVTATQLTREFRGPELAEQIEAATGLSTAAALRLGWKLEHLYERLLAHERGPDPKRSGKLLTVRSLFAVGLIVATGAVLGWVYAAASAPLTFEWTHAGETRILATPRKPFEAKALWIERHADSLATAMIRMPPDDPRERE